MKKIIFTDWAGEHNSLDIKKCSNPLCKELTEWEKLTRDLEKGLTGHDNRTESDQTENI